MMMQTWQRRPSLLALLLFIHTLDNAIGSTSLATKDHQGHHSATATTSEEAEKSESLVRSKRKTDRLTAYACEDTTLNITCGPDLYLDVIRANYGRFSITICNDHGNTDWKVDCQAGRTLRAMQARCSNKKQCIVPVQSSIFGDPCPGTYKYIEVHYACRKEPIILKTTTPRSPFPDVFTTISPRPSVIWPNLIKNVSESSLQNTTEIIPPLEDIEHEGLDEPQDIHVPVPIVPYDFDNWRNITKPYFPIDFPHDVEHVEESTEKVNNMTTKRPPSLQVLANFTQYCPPAKSRNLFWNWTLAGDVAVVQCPSGSNGFAKWSCNHPDANRAFESQVSWSTKGPTLAECRSLWLGDLDSKLRSGLVSVTNVSKILAEKSAQFNKVPTSPDLNNADNPVIFGGDLVLAARMLKQMAERMHYVLQRTVNLEAREALVTDLVQNVVKTASNLISDSSDIRQSWSDLMGDELGRAATALMVGLEENAFLLAETVTTEKIIIKPTENILLSIRVMQSRNAHRQIFPSIETNEFWQSSGDLIVLSPESILQNGNNGAVRVIFTAYNQLDQILIPLKNSNHRSWMSSSEDQSRHRFINSRIIAASLGRGRHIELPQPVKITFKHLNEVDPSRVRPECVYWDYVSNAWSDEGCHAILSNVTHTQCSCNHLTNFALLMSHTSKADSHNGLFESTAPIKSQKSPSKGLSNLVLTIICSVAALVVIVALVTFAVIAWRKFKVSHQCRSALQNSGLPCFHKVQGGEINTDKDKGNNKGNFYTVTPKLNGNPSGVSSPNEEEVVEARQFFEHMINLQKNEQNHTRSMRRSINEQGPEQANESKTMEHKKLEIVYPKRSNYARALSPYNHIYMEIEPQEQQQQPVYEPLTHSETYLMSTMSDMSEDNYNYINGLNSDVSRQSSARESRPLIRSISTEPRANLLQTISGVLHSQSVRITPSGNNSMTLQPIRRNLSATLHHPITVANVNGNDFVRLNLDHGQNEQATYIASTTSDIQQPTAQQQLMTNAYLGKHQQFQTMRSMVHHQAAASSGLSKTAQITQQQPQFASEI